MHGNHVSYMLPILVMISIAELQVMLERSPSCYQQLKIVELLTLHTVFRIALPLDLGGCSAA